jgi:hypothetical protein
MTDLGLEGGQVLAANRGTEKCGDSARSNLS